MKNKKIYKIFEEKIRFIKDQMDDGRRLSLLVTEIDKAKGIDKKELSPEDQLFINNYSSLSKERKEVENLFIEALKQQYGISQVCINIAMQLQDMSDNGSSFESLEEYIVLLKKAIDKEEV